MSMAAPSLDHLARLDIARLVSPSVTIKSTKAPFPDGRERATVRLLATAGRATALSAPFICLTGRSLSHRVLERELSLQREPYPSIAKFRYIHRTLSHMSVSRFVTKVMSIGAALKGTSCRRKALGDVLRLRGLGGAMPDAGLSSPRLAAQPPTTCDRGEY